MASSRRASRLSRRDFLALGASALGAAYLAACGDGGGSTARRTEAPAGPSPFHPTTLPLSFRWGRVDPAGGAPPARRDHSLVTDGENLFLFGGRAGNMPVSDLWAYTIDLNEWFELTPPQGPSARFGHNAVWDSQRGRMLVFGGQAGPNEFFNDLWEFDPVARAWSQVTPSGSTPEARYGAGAAYDPAGRLLLTHGFTNGGRFDDLWQFDEAWEDITHAGERPVERCLMRVVWDELRSQLFLFGGQTNATPYLDDIWFYSESLGWQRLNRVPRPSARNLYSMVYEPDRFLALLFGGHAQDGLTNDLWAWDSTDQVWLIPAIDGDRPAARESHDAAWSRGERAMYVFGGNEGGSERNDLWRLSDVAS